MNILKNLRTNTEWLGTVRGDTFTTNDAKLDFDITQPYSIDSRHVKIVKQTTNAMYKTVLRFTYI